MEPTHIFARRKELKHLSEAEAVEQLKGLLEQAKLLYNGDQSDEWKQRALAWVLMDCIKMHIKLEELDDANTLNNELRSLPVCRTDELLARQLSLLAPKLTEGSEIVNRAVELSKSGNHDGALNIFRTLFKRQRLSPEHHEAYGWALQRKLQQQKQTLEFLTQKQMLAEYMLLNNERPGLLHSVILGYVVSLSPKPGTFDLETFIKMWGTENLREEDFRRSYNDGKYYPALADKLLRAAVTFSNDPDIQFWVGLMKKYGQHVDTTVEKLREAYFWKVHSLVKSGNRNKTIPLFNFYAKHLSAYSYSESHSKVLGYAEYLLNENHAGDFLLFFKNWTPGMVAEQDWEEVKKDDAVFKPLAVKCIQTAFKGLNGRPPSVPETEWLSALYNEAVERYPANEWLLRGKANFLKLAGRKADAVQAFHDALLKLNDKEYVWAELAGCYGAEDRERLLFLSKAVEVAYSDDYLGNSRIDLAESLIEHGKISLAQKQLELYAEHRRQKEWAFSGKYEKLVDRISATGESEATESDDEYVQKCASEAEEIVYKSISWRLMVCTGKFVNKQGKTRYRLSDGEGTVVNAGNTGAGKNLVLKPGALLNTKVHRDADGRSRLLQLRAAKGEPWKCLPLTYGLVDYINTDKKVMHLVTLEGKQVYIKEQNGWRKGDCFKARTDKETDRNNSERIHLYDLQKVASDDLKKRVEPRVVVADSINENKKLFHIIGDRKSDAIVPYSKTDLRPEPGDFLEVWAIHVPGKQTGTFRLHVLDIKSTDKTNDDLIRMFEGFLSVKYRDYNSTGFPDFAFLNDIYVHKKLLKKAGIDSDCKAHLWAVRGKDGKWTGVKVDRMDTV